MALALAAHQNGDHSGDVNHQPISARLATEDEKQWRERRVIRLGGGESGISAHGVAAKCRLQRNSHNEIMWLSKMAVIANNGVNIS